MALRLPELIVIFVVALLIFGPKKLPEMGSQIGKSINAFRKGMNEFRHPLDDSLESDSFMASHKEITKLEARRLELEILERELAVKRAEAALRATQAGIPPYTSETSVDAYVESEAIVEQDYVESEVTVDEDYAKSETTVDKDSPSPETTAHTPVESGEATDAEKEAHALPKASTIAE